MMKRDEVMTLLRLPLSPLALAQLRLDVEAAAIEMGCFTSGPVDQEFFDPFELDESHLEREMLRLKLPGNFAEMKKKAEARFPLRKTPPDGSQAGWFVDRHKSLNWLGMKGVLAQAANWFDAQQLAKSEFEKFASAVDLPDGSPARALIDTIAQRLSTARSMGFFEYSSWSQFAAATLFSKKRFDLLFDVASDMAIMFANELSEALADESLAERMDRKVQSGGAPSVTYRFKHGREK